MNPLKVVHLSPTTQSVLTKKEIVAEANAARDRQIEKRLRKKYNLPKPDAQPKYRS